MKKRFDVCIFLLSRNEGEPVLYRIVTCDEKWILYDNRKRSASWLDKDEAPKHNPKPNIHQKKLMVTAWWSSHGLIHYTLIKPGQSITAETYSLADPFERTVREYCFCSELLNKSCRNKYNTFIF